MLNIRFLTCSQMELWDLTFCIEVNVENIQSQAMTLTLVRQCPISKMYELFLYTTKYFNFMLLDRFLFELSCKNTETWKNTHI